jgi:hypothetical protein
MIRAGADASQPFHAVGNLEFCHIGRLIRPLPSVFPLIATSGLFGRATDRDINLSVRERGKH